MIRNDENQRNVAPVDNNREHFNLGFPALEDEANAPWNREIEALQLGQQAAAGAGLIEQAAEGHFSRENSGHFSRENSVYLSQAPVYRHFRFMGTRIYPFSRGYNDERIPIIGWIFGNFRAERANMRDMSNKIVTSV